MGASVDYLVSHPQTGRLMFRRAFPADLRPFVPGRPVQLKRSLGAKNIAEPGAMDRFQAASAEYDRLATAARKMRDRAFDRLDDATLAYLAKLFERELQEDAEAAVRAGNAEKERGGWQWHLDDFREWRLEQDGRAAAEFWGRHARKLLEAHGKLLDPEDEEAFGAFCLALNDAAIAASGDVKARLAGEVLPIPPEPPAPGAAAKPPKGATFQDIVESLLENKRLAVGAATKQATRTALRSFRETHGLLLPEEITKARVSAWLDLLAESPSKVSAAERKLPLPELVARYEGRDVKRLTPKTLAVNLGVLAARWSKAQEDEGLIAETLANPFARKLDLRAAPRPASQRLTREDVKGIFSLPVFTAGERPKGGKGEAAYWMPLLLLWTGARPEEIAQLIVADVTQDEETGRWMLRITDEDPHPHKKPRTLKTGRTQSGRRRFPIPQPLMDLGFLRYVEHVRASGEAALFPALRTKGERKLLFAGFSEWWGAYLREHKALPEGKRQSREFRHFWSTAARVSGIAREAMEYIQGHKPDEGRVQPPFDPISRRIADADEGASAVGVVGDTAHEFVPLQFRQPPECG